jgi:RHS repeat-associated protein
MKAKLLLLSAMALILAVPHEVLASGACTAARFHDWQDGGCNQCYAGAGGASSGQSNAGGNQSQCQNCQTNGMPSWWVSEPYENLCMSDTPLAYTLSSGQQMNFTFYYRQRTKLPDADELPTYWIHPRNSAHYPALNNGSTCGTNATWNDNWSMSILFWDYYWEYSASYNSGTRTYIPPGYTPFSRNYEALVFRPNGEINYFYETNNGAAVSLQDRRSQAFLAPVSSLGYPTVTNVPGSDTNGIYWGDPGIGLKLVYPDGSQDVFGLLGYGPSSSGLHGYVDSTSQAFLTERIDPQGRVTRLGYELTAYTNFYQFSFNYTPLYYCFRLKYVVDPDGRTNTFGYCPASQSTPVDNPFQLSQIQDPYGRHVSIGNQFSGAPTQLTIGYITNIVDAVGMTNSFYYLGNDGWIGLLNTPYGNTRFCYYQVPDASQTVIDGYQQRAVYVTEPTGAQQLYLYYHNNPTEAASDIAPTVSGQSFDDGNTGSFDSSLIHRNTYRWGRLQFDALSSNSTFNVYIGYALYWEENDNLASSATYFSEALAALSQNDFNKADLKHWLLWSGDDVSITESLSSERDPSPDIAGQIPGLRTWYNYTGKPSGEPELLGYNPQIACIARPLPDGTSQYTVYDFYASGSAAGMVADNVSSYSTPNGTVGTLTNWFGYAGNGADLTSVSNSAGQYAVAGYNGNHEITAITNALGQVTTFNYDNYNTWNLTGIQWPGGATLNLNLFYGQWSGTNWIPNPNAGFIQEAQFEPQGRTFTFTNYIYGLPGTVTDDRGLTVTNTFDGLNRLTSTEFPDGTTISNSYTFLDLGATKDRLNNWTFYGYDGLRHLVAITNANNGVTTLDWCGCGSLKSVLDPLSNLTTLNYDNQGNLTNLTFPDYSSLTYQYDLAGRMTNVFDGAGRALHLTYNNQDLVTAANGAYGPLEKTSYDAVNRPVSVTDANGVVVTNAFDAISELSSRTWPDGTGESFGYSAAGLVAYTNRDGQVTRYGLDTAGRMVAATNANQEVVRLSYNSLNEVVALTNGLTQKTTWQYNEYGLLTNKTDALGRDVLQFAYNPDEWATNRWTPEKGNTRYAYDNVGNLKTTTYPLSTINYLYDADNELTNMADASGTNVFAYTAAGQLQSEAGPWPTDTVVYIYNQQLRTNLTVSEPGGSWPQDYSYDSERRMTGISSPAGAFGYSYNVQPASFLVSGITLPNGASIANSYDSLARLTQTTLANHWGHVLDGYTYAVDPLGLRTNILRNLGLTSSSVGVRYDNIGQLIGWLAKETNGVSRFNEQLGFEFDAADNLHFRTNGALSQTFTVDDANELTNVSRIGAFTFSGATPAPATIVTVNGQTAQTYGDFTFAATNLSLFNGNNNFTSIARNVYGATATNTITVNLPSPVTLLYDNNGNLTNDGARTFGYDAENQLTNVFMPGQWRSDFIYDGLGRRRIVRQYAWSGGTWTKTNEIHLIYDGYLPIQERDSNDNVLVTYTRGLDLSGNLGAGLPRQSEATAGGIGGLLARTDANGSTLYHSDVAGNITALMDGQEDIVARYMYGPFGKVIGQWGAIANANEMQFSSMPRDSLSGVSFYPFRAYEPNYQRWLNEDPIQEMGGINLYRAMNNNPVSWIDPLGLEGGDPTGDEDERAASGGPELGAWADLDYESGEDWAQAYKNETENEMQSQQQEQQQRAQQLELPLTGARPGNKGPTSGVLCDKNGNQFSLISGQNGPAQNAQKGPGSGFDRYTSTHVEGHAAALMDQQGINQATLYINNPVICPNCNHNLPSMLPSGASLTVVLPNGTTATYIGK